MTWREQDWDDAYYALEDTVKAIRQAQRLMLDRRLSYENKVGQITLDLHKMRRGLDECAAAVEQTEAERRAFELVGA